jgi:hypothetical protein
MYAREYYIRKVEGDFRKIFEYFCAMYYVHALHAHKLNHNVNIKRTDI